MEARSTDQIITDIFYLYEAFGGDEYAGEKVSQLEHMSQAAQLAIHENQSDEVVLAAFFHDIGHLLPVHDEYESMDGFGVTDHEKLGANYLRSLGFSETLCRLIASHVNAKRYLTYKHPGYYQQLSEASKVTLEYQGGRMTEEESKAFESDPLFNLYIKMRTWDEAAKMEQVPLPDLAYFKKLAIKHLNRSGRFESVGF